MSESKQTARIHFILDNQIWAQRTVYFVPRVGDEVRFDGRIFLVAHIVWPMDEENYPRSRVNIEITPVVLPRKKKKSIEEPKP